jgi:hypothetical protein
MAVDTSSLPAPGARTPVEVPDRKSTPVDNVNEEALSLLTEALVGLDKSSVMASPYRHFWPELAAMQKVAMRESDNEEAKGSSPGKDAAAKAGLNLKAPAEDAKGRYRHVNS